MKLIDVSGWLGGGEMIGKFVFYFGLDCCLERATSKICGEEFCLALLPIFSI